MAETATRALGALPAIPGLEVVSELGRGASSAVFKAKKAGRHYAVKLAREDLSGRSEEGRAFLREAGTLSRLRHPGLCAILDVGEAEGRPFLVMEYAEGKPLDEMLRRGPLGEEAVVRLAKDLAGALSEVHRNGWVHRDLKPGNIVVEPAGIARLIDFGLASQARSTLSGDAVVGTFLYSAPEQTGMLKRPVDARADLYSLGVVLFECLTGRPPFEAPDIGELVRLHAVEAAPDVRSFGRPVTGALAQVVRKLLAKDPDDRYPSAEALLADVEALSSLNAQLDRGEEVLLGTGEARREVEHGPLVGRDAELLRLTDAWHKTQEGRGSILLVEGSPGQGKTRLVQELRKLVSRGGGTVLTSKSAAGDPLPFSVIRALIDHLFAHLAVTPAAERTKTEQRLRAAAGDQASLLCRLTTGLSRLFPEAVPSQAAEHGQLLEAVAGFLGGLDVVLDAPVLLVVDDLQWVDDSSLQVLRRLAGKLSQARILVVATARTDAPSQERVEAAVRLLAVSEEARVRLESLADAAVARLVTVLLGGLEVDEEVIRRIVLRSQGSPLAAGEMVSAMLENGLVRPSWGRWVVAPEGLDRVALPSDVFELILQRAGGLGPRTKAVLGAAAGLGARFGLELLPEVCCLSREEVEQAIDEACRARLVERSERGYAFVHDRVREALHPAQGSTEARNLHQRIAEALDTAGAEESERVFEVAAHYVQGDWSKKPQRLFDTSFAAGRRALEAFAMGEAAPFLSHALEASRQLRPEPPPELLGALGDALAAIGRVEEAVVHFERALTLGGLSGLARAALRARLVRLHTHTRTTRAARRELEEAFRDLGEPRPTASGWQVAGAVVQFFWAMARLRWGRGRVASGKERERLKVLCELCELAGRVAFFEGNNGVELLVVVGKNLAAAARLGPSRELVNSFGNCSALFGILGLTRIAEHFTHRALAASKETDDRVSQARSVLFEMYWRHFAGQCVRAAELGRRCLQEHGHWLDTTDYMNGCADLAFNLAFRGYTREARAWSLRGFERLKNLRWSAEGLPDNPDLAFMATAEALFGNPEAGLALLDRLRELVDRTQRFNFFMSSGYVALYHLERGELSGEVDRVIADGLQMGIHPGRAPIHLKSFYVNAGLVRLDQAMVTDGPARRSRLKQLKQTIRLLRAASKTAPFRGYLEFLQGALKRLEGHAQMAEDHFARASRLGWTVDSPALAYEVARQRAHALLERGLVGAAKREATGALTVALEQGWTGRADRLRAEFALKDSWRVPARASSSNSVRLSGRAPTLRLERHLDALLQVSLAAAEVLDPELQAKAALDAVVRVLGAERAFLFALDGERGSLVLRAGRNAQGRDIPEDRTYSRTIIERVRATREPLVLSRSADGAVLGSESVIAHDLRSVMAAPLVMKDRLLGVVYLDNRLASGVFTQDDVEILTALSNHVAIAMETARAAQVELERTALAKDLALTAAVQGLFLPKESSYENKVLALAGWYSPASQCGGDWWWHESLPGGGTVVLLGDVTGHGPASAMLTAAVASAYGLFRKLQPEGELVSLLRTLDAQLRAFSGGEYAMTLSALEVLPGTAKAKWIFAGAPPLLLREASGSVRAFSRPSAPLGTSQGFFVETAEVPFCKGDRLFLASDGIAEMVLPSGKLLGTRQLVKLLSNAGGASATEAREQFVSGLEQLRRGTPLADDLTFVVVEAL